MTDNRGDQFAQHARAVAIDLYGEPNKHLSSKDEMRFGTNGSLSVEIKAGTFFDHEAKEGGGVLWAIQRETGLAGGEAVQWLRDHGYHIEDRDDGWRPAQANGGDRPASRLDPAGNWLPPQVPDNGRQTAVYDYREADGTLRYQVVRFDWDDPSNPKGHSKTFLQRKPDTSKRNGFSWKVKGTVPLPYRLPELLEDIADGAEIFFVEGEKKVDMLREIGVPATCNSGGAGKFPDELLEWFRGAKVTILPDNDPAGLEHRGKVGNKLLDVAARVRVLDLPGLPLKGGVDDWLPAGGSADQLYALAVSARPFEAVPFQSRFGAVQWHEIDAPGPSYEQLIKGVLTKGELSFLLGESQSGKSFLAIDMNMAVARGIEWFGRRVRGGLVIYQAGESATGVRRRRLPAYREHYQVAGEQLPFVLLQSALDLYSSDDPTDAFIEECLYWQRHHDRPLELITIDTFNKATPGANENDGKDMGLVLARCDRIRKATGAHVMLVHHLNAGGSKARGHTSLFANVENVLLCRVVPDHSDGDGRKIREAVIAKQKDGEDGVAIRFVLPQVKIGVDPEDGKDVTSCIVAPPSGEAGAKLPATGAVQLGGTNAKVLRVVYDLLSDQLSYDPAPIDLGLPQGARVVSSKAVTARFAETEKPENFDEMSEDDKEKERARIRQQIKRARDHLYAKRIIGMKGDHVWATGKTVLGFGPPPGSRPRRSAEEAAEPAPLGDLPFSDEDVEAFING